MRMTDVWRHKIKAMVIKDGECALCEGMIFLIVGSNGGQGFSRLTQYKGHNLCKTTCSMKTPWIYTNRCYTHQRCHTGGLACNILKIETCYQIDHEYLKGCIGWKYENMNLEPWIFVMTNGNLLLAKIKPPEPAAVCDSSDPLHPNANKSIVYLFSSY